MKRFWLILLSLGLVMAFSVSAFAVDVQVSGEYFAAGLYLNKTALWDQSSDVTSHHWGPYNGGWWGHRDVYTLNSEQPSTAFFYQRLRIGTDFVVSPCLKLVTQFDGMERIWGGQRSDVDAPDAHGAGTRAEAENISIRQVHIDYTSPIGLFKVGYMEDFVWGTVFGDRSSGPTSGQIQYFFQKGPFTGFVGYAKEGDNSASAVTTGVTTTDQDFDSYRIAGIYNFKGGEVGILGLFNRNATDKADMSWVHNPSGPPWHIWIDSGYLQNVYTIQPYFKATIGPVAIQGEFQYWFGDAVKMENSALTGENVSIGAMSVFLDATAKFGMFYAGGSFAYLSGDDPGTTDKVEGGVNTGGLDWNPCLIMFNNDLNYWAGNIYGYDGSELDGEMSNAWFFQGRVGVKPTPKWDIMLAVSYAMADKKPAGYPNGTYGTEVDLTATYKITNNLTYTLGGGYLFTGDYFKGYDNGQPVGTVHYVYYRGTLEHTRDSRNFTVISNDTDNDFMIMNKLTLSF